MNWWDGMWGRNNKNVLPGGLVSREKASVWIFLWYDFCVWVFVGFRFSILEWWEVLFTPQCEAMCCLGFWCFGWVYLGPKGSFSSLIKTVVHWRSVPRFWLTSSSGTSRCQLFRLISWSKNCISNTRLLLKVGRFQFPNCKVSKYSKYSVSYFQISISKNSPAVVLPLSAA